ncbi:uncharacterized protein BCR38DRAFT_422722 [Pseudomassariella vexata]|uniref:C2H2-type domain-containing protein n=1 Tax=Pseudomassariella vexata TaxID=1141098 RepID=A0A1Y2EAM5_9PEZI|nr:uncharacterized protein BCR38DRAFT_422722 [Pseudomassariella vexata]ORY68306.1 hypothetical protein BCR38DRAFT_422722 [Pseudomassariella vexata]
MSADPLSGANQPASDLHGEEAAPTEYQYNGRFYEESMPDIKGIDPGSDGKFHCWEEGCNHKDDGRRHLMKHLRTHYKPVKCPKPDCGRRAAEQREMIRHVQSCHVAWANKQPKLKVQEFFCDLCGAPFRRKDYIRKHQRYSCPIVKGEQRE